MAKPKPAPIFEKERGKYRLHFSYNGKQYRRHLISQQHVANVLQGRVNSRIIEFKMGITAPPAGISLPDFIFSVTEDKKEDIDKLPSMSVTTLTELIDEYQRLTVPPIKAESTCRTENTHIEHMRKFVKSQLGGDPFLEEINVGFFNIYKKYRYVAGIHTDTVKKELGTFQRVFAMAVEHGYVKYNIVRDVKRDVSQVPCDRFRTSAEIEEMLKHGEYTRQEISEIKRFRYLTEDEIKELLALAKGRWIYPILVFCAHTGIRRGEITKLEWEDVDLERRLLWIRSHKQSRTQREIRRCIDINDELLPILREQKKKTGTDRWVFTAPAGGQLEPGSLRETFRHLVKGTKFEGVGYHAFRHSLASNLAARGIDQRVIDNLLGHQTEEMRQRYRHLFPKQRQDALSKLTYL